MPEPISTLPVVRNEHVHQMPFGTRIIDGLVNFQIWAPGRQTNGGLPVRRKGQDDLADAVIKEWLVRCGQRQSRGRHEVSIHYRRRSGRSRSGFALPTARCAWSQ